MKLVRPWKFVKHGMEKGVSVSVVEELDDVRVAGGEGGVDGGDGGGKEGGREEKSQGGEGNEAGGEWK